MRTKLKLAQTHLIEFDGHKHGAYVSDGDIERENYAEYNEREPLPTRDHCPFLLGNNEVNYRSEPITCHVKRRHLSVTGHRVRR